MASLGYSSGTGPALRDQNVPAGNQWEQPDYMEPSEMAGIRAGLHNVLSSMLMNISGDNRPQIMTHIGSNVVPQYVTLNTKQMIESGQVISTERIFDHYSLTGADDYLQLLAQVDNVPQGSTMQFWKYTFEPGELNEAAELDGFTEMRSVHSSMQTYFKLFSKGFEFSSDALLNSDGVRLLQGKFKQLRIAYLDTRQFYTLNAVLDANKTNNGNRFEPTWNPTRTFNEAVGISVEDWDGFRKSANFFYNICSRGQEVTRARNGDPLNLCLMAPEQALAFNTQTGKGVFFIGGEKGVSRAETLNGTYLGSVTGDNGQVMKIVTVRGNQHVLGIFNRVNETLSITGTRHYFRNPSGSHWAENDRKIWLYNPELDILEEVFWEDALANCPLWIKGPMGHDGRPKDPLHGYVRPMGQWLTDDLMRRMTKDGVMNTPFYFQKNSGNMFGNAPAAEHEDDAPTKSMHKRRRTTAGPTTAQAQSTMQEILNNMLPCRLVGQLRPGRDIAANHFAQAANSYLAGWGQEQSDRFKRSVRILNKYADMENNVAVNEDTLAYLRSFIVLENRYEWTDGQNAAGHLYRRDQIFAGPNGTVPSFYISASQGDRAPVVPVGMCNPLGYAQLVHQLEDTSVAKWRDMRTEIASALSDFEDCMNSHIMSTFAHNAFCDESMASLTNLQKHVPTIIWENFVRGKGGVVPLYVDVVVGKSRPAANQLRGDDTTGRSHERAEESAIDIMKRELSDYLSKGMTDNQSTTIFDAITAEPTIGLVSLYLAGIRVYLSIVRPDLTGEQQAEFDKNFDALLALQTENNDDKPVTPQALILAQNTIFHSLKLTTGLTKDAKKTISQFPDAVFAAYSDYKKVEDDPTMQLDDIAPVGATGSNLYLTTLTVSRAFADKLKAYNRKNKISRNETLPEGIYFYPADELNPHMPDLNLRTGGIDEMIKTMPHSVRSHYALFSGKVPVGKTKLERERHPAYDASLDDTDAEMAEIHLAAREHPHIIAVKNVFHAFSYSAELRQNIAWIWSEESDAAVRLIMQLFATSPLCEHQLAHFGRRGIRPLLNVYVGRPSIGFRMLSLILMHQGYNTGAVYSKNLKLVSQVNGINGLIQVKLKVELANMVKKPQNIIRQTNSMVYRYGGGMNNRFIKLGEKGRSTDRELDKVLRGEYPAHCGSLISFVEPPAHRDASSPFLFIPPKDGKISGLGANISDVSMAVSKTGWLYHALFDFCDLRVDMGSGRTADETAVSMNRLMLTGATWYSDELGHPTIPDAGNSHTSHMGIATDSKPGYRQFLTSTACLQ